MTVGKPYGKLSGSGGVKVPKMVKLHNNTYDNLKLLKKPKESFSEVTDRLIALYHTMQKIQAEEDSEGGEAPSENKD